MLVGAGIYTSRSYHAISALKARRMASNLPSFLILDCSLFRNTVLYLIRVARNARCLLDI